MAVRDPLAPFGLRGSDRSNVANEVRQSADLRFRVVHLVTERTLILTTADAAEVYMHRISRVRP
jgi:hypothetical protein